MGLAFKATILPQSLPPLGAGIIDMGHHSRQGCALFFNGIIMSPMWPQSLDVGSPGSTVRFHGFSILFSAVTPQLLFSINSPQGSQFPPLPLQHVYLWGTFDRGHLLRSGAL